MMKTCSKFVEIQGMQLISFLESKDDISPTKLIVLFNPMPQEITRSYWLYRQISTTLARSQNAVVRFDLPGTGDSEGSLKTTSWQQWKDASLSLATTFIEQFPHAWPVFVGVRLGGNLAQSVRDRLDRGTSILIDPISNGNRYVKEMKNLQGEFVGHNQHAAPFMPKKPIPQCFGFSWPEKLTSEIKEIKLNPNQHTYVLTSNPDSDLSETVLYVSDDFSWSNPHKLGLRAFPNQTAKLVNDLVGRLK